MAPWDFYTINGISRVTQQIEKIPEQDDIETEWENIKTIITTAAMKV
jgi:hypothetical protein